MHYPTNMIMQYSAAKSKKNWLMMYIKFTLTSNACNGQQSHKKGTKCSSARTVFSKNMHN